MRYAFMVLFGVILLVLIPIAVWQFRVDTADIKGRGDATMTVNSAAYRMQRYDYFWALCVSVQNAETTIDAETLRLEQETNDNVKSRILQNISASQSARARSINEYNAEAQKENAQEFRDSKLPERLNSESYEKGDQRTQCVV